ncbi:BQ2448_2953 [Microbotryum intermedium]|uniref:BQ2448_2953 protein n=1 Tax=Microbotryum intermedium TaxID=269621 RepID=A0A238FDW7_9BASI|nr:BQ2448_2953 [Microbotryum intermedium]
MITKKHVLILPEGGVSGTEGLQNHRFLRLPHPRTRRPSLLLANQSGAGALFEVQRVDQGGSTRTWFVDQEVVDDGSLLLLTPFDPLFLVIPLSLSLTISPHRILRHSTSGPMYTTTSCKPESLGLPLAPTTDHRPRPSSRPSPGSLFPTCGEDNIFETNSIYAPSEFKHRAIFFDKLINPRPPRKYLYI